MVGDPTIGQHLGLIMRSGGLLTNLTDLVCSAEMPQGRAYIQRPECFGSHGETFFLSLSCHIGPTTGSLLHGIRGCCMCRALGGSTPTNDMPCFNTFTRQGLTALPGESPGRDMERRRDDRGPASFLALGAEKLYVLVVDGASHLVPRRDPS